jgi:hypothetical protein
MLSRPEATSVVQQVYKVLSDNDKLAVCTGESYNMLATAKVKAESFLHDDAISFLISLPLFALILIVFLCQYLLFYPSVRYLTVVAETSFSCTYSPRAQVPLTYCRAGCAETFCSLLNESGFCSHVVAIYWH